MMLKDSNAKIIIDKCYLAETEAQILSSGMSQKLTKPHGLTQKLVQCPSHTKMPEPNLSQFASNVNRQ